MNTHTVSSECERSQADGASLSDHCRGFIKGIIRGCLVGPVAGVVFASLLIAFEYESVRNELGPISVLLGWVFHGVPLGAVAGGFVGAIHDALRIRDVERWIVVICLLPIFLVLVVLPIVSWIIKSDAWLGRESVFKHEYGVSSQALLNDQHSTRPQSKRREPFDWGSVAVALVESFRFESDFTRS